MVMTKSKSFVIDRREALLVVPESSDYHGAEVRAKLDVDVRTFLELQTITDGASADELRIAFTLFGDAIVKKWNLEDDDGHPIPPTGDGLMTLPPSFCTALIGSWAEQAGTAGKA